MTFYGPQSCSLPACKGSKTSKIPKPSPTPSPAPQIHSNAYGPQKPAKDPNFPNRPPCTLGPRPLPQQAPQGQATAMAFYGLSKLPFASPQTLQSPSKIPGHPMAFQATAMRLFKSCRLPARKPSKTPNPPNAPNPPKPAKPSKHRPQQAPRSTAMTSNHLPSVHGMILQA